jgi:predicted DNA-binding protein with PD1-like motif
MNVHAFRLKQGDLLRESIESFCSENNISSGVMVTAVGNVRNAHLRMADERVVKEYSSEFGFEVVSLVGTIAQGDAHLHMSISDEDGKVYGGHLKYGTVVGVTCEIVLGEIVNLQFCREFDENTGFEELSVNKK